MSSRASSRPSRRRDDSSSSLEGMEKPLRPQEPMNRPPRIDSIIDLYSYKPLPDTPARPCSSLPDTPGRPCPSPLSFVSSQLASSSTSRISTNSEESLSLRSGGKEPKKRLKGSKKPHGLNVFKTRDSELFISASPPDILDGALERGRSASPSVKSGEPHPGSRCQTPSREPKLEDPRETQFNEWKAPKYRPGGKKTEHAPQVISQALRERDRADEYRELIEDVSPQSPESQALLPMCDPNFQPSPLTPPSTATWTNMASACCMESRISNVLDQPLMPEILHEIKGEEEEEWIRKRRSEEDRDSIHGEDPSHEDSMFEDDPVQEEYPIDERRGSTAPELEAMADLSRTSARLRDGVAPRRRPSSRYPEEGMRPNSEIGADYGLHIGRSLRLWTRRDSFKHRLSGAIDRMPSFRPARRNSRGAVIEGTASQIDEEDNEQTPIANPKQNILKRERLYGDIPETPVAAEKHSMSKGESTSDDVSQTRLANVMQNTFREEGSHKGSPIPSAVRQKPQTAGSRPRTSSFGMQSSPEISKINKRTDSDLFSEKGKAVGKKVLSALVKSSEKKAAKRQYEEKRVELKNRIRHPADLRPEDVSPERLSDGAAF